MSTVKKEEMANNNLPPESEKGADGNSVPTPTSPPSDSGLTDEAELLSTLRAVCDDLNEALQLDPPIDISEKATIESMFAELRSLEDDGIEITLRDKERVNSWTWEFLQEHKIIPSDEDLLIKEERQKGKIEARIAKVREEEERKFREKVRKNLEIRRSLLGEIVWFLKKLKSNETFTKQDIVNHLLEKFPERDLETIKRNVRVYVPAVVNNKPRGVYVIREPGGRFRKASLAEMGIVLGPTGVRVFRQWKNLRYADGSRPSPATRRFIWKERIRPRLELLNEATGDLRTWLKENVVLEELDLNDIKSDAGFHLVLWLELPDGSHKITYLNRKGKHKRKVEEIKKRREKGIVTMQKWSLDGNLNPIRKIISSDVASVVGKAKQIRMVGVLGVDDRGKLYLMSSWNPFQQAVVNPVQEKEEEQDEEGGASKDAGASGPGNVGG